MKIERTRNTIEGSIWGIIEKIFNLLLPFIVRTILIQTLGVEYLGLSSLFTSILQVLNLTELGFGSAVVYSMYKPIANDDTKEVCAIVCYLKKIYQLIGIIILTIGICLLPFISNFINGEVPSDINIYILYLIYLINTSLSYFLFAYKSSILSALQNNNIISKVGLLTSSVLRIFQIIVLIVIKNFYAYVILIPIITIINNLIISIIVSKKYPQYLEKEPINEETRKKIKKNIFPLMSTKIAAILLNSADTLVISTFLGLNAVALYNNYYYIINSLMGVLLVIYNSMQAGIGNSLVVDNQSKIIQDFDKFCFINSWLVTVCTVCLLCLYQNFMEIWLGKDMLLPFGMVILFSTYFYANTIQRIVVIYKDAAGIWRKDMVRCYLSCGLNLLVNILTVNYIGLYGVIGSTVLANVVGLPWMAYILYKNVFKISSKDFYKAEIKNLFITIIICTLCYLICNLLPSGFVGLIIKGLVSLIVSNIILLIAYRKNSKFIIVKKWCISKLTKRKEVQS